MDIPITATDIIVIRATSIEAIAMIAMAIAIVGRVREARVSSTSRRMKTYSP
jgi:hypothetical protein